MSSSSHNNTRKRRLAQTFEETWYVTVFIYCMGLIFNSLKRCATDSTYKRLNENSLPIVSEPCCDLEEDKDLKRWSGFVDKKASTVQLDPAIWGWLPIEIQLRLVEYLPVPSLCRFRSVSKLWDEACRSVKEVKAHGKCYLAWRHGKEFWVYSTLDQAWLYLPLVPTATKHNPRVVLSYSQGHLSILDSSYTSHNYIFWVNPFYPARFGYLKDVPPVVTLYFGGTVLLQDYSHIFVMVVPRDEDCTGDPFIRMYHSKTEKWSSYTLRLGDSDKFMYIGESLIDRNKCAVLCGSTLYFLALSTAANEVNLYSLDVFDSSGHCQRESSVGMPVKSPPSFDGSLSFEHHFLVTCSGRVVMVHLLAESKSVILWVFDEREKIWKLLSSFPVNTTGFRYAYSSQDEVYICVSSTLIVYHMPTSTWHDLYPLGDSALRIFPFQPTMLV